MFDDFLKNLKGDTFFGTCLDGKAVYSLLVGKPGHVFRSGGKTYAEFTKDYSDGDGWSDQFGLKMRVMLESFEKPSEEYLVPFETVKTKLESAGFTLVHSELFSDLYHQQTEIRLRPDQQEFSFLHRAFVFRRAEAEEAPVEEAAAPVPAEPEVATEEEKPKEEARPAPVKRKKKLAPVPEGPEPVLFSVADESKGDHRVFSNEYVIPTLIGGVTYPTVEHYMVVQKARQFGDEKAVQKVMKAKTAKSAKGVEKSIEGVTEDEWDAKKDEVMRVALRAKFTQHPELRKHLLDTGDAVLGYANARDKYWSIGTSEDTDKAKKPAKWPGQNKLGKLLMELRNTLRGEGAE